MATHMIFILMRGCLDPDLESQLAARLPMTLRRVEHTDECAPDYRINAGDAVEVGFSWSRTTPGSTIPYIAIIIKHSPATQISGVAWQSPDRKGR